MLKKLRFQNWRSLQNVTIEDLTPITVLIGANSSGKTNIVDAMDFRRAIIQKGIVQTVLELGYTKIQTDARREDGIVELEFTYDVKELSRKTITQTLLLEFEKRDVPFKSGLKLFEGNKELHNEPLRELPLRDVIQPVDIFNGETFELSLTFSSYLSDLILKRWQILGDSFVPPLELSNRDGGSPYVIEPDARNLLLMLRFMDQSYRELYGNLQNDLRFILSHFAEFDVWRWREDDDLRLLVREAVGRTAPTVSTGTARLIAILTAMYALDIPQDRSSGTGILSAKDPGLLVIEEPDTALNPGILRNFVQLLRDFVTGENPRQVILTTHNPRFLDYFEPEEVRVVERDQQGYTTVKKLPEHIRELWLDDHTLGEVWMTRSLGGLPE